MKPKRFFAVLLAALILLPAAACGSRDTAGMVFYYNMEDEPSTVDPQQVDSENEMLITDNIFEGLFKSGNDGSLKKAAAADYTLSDDRLTYTITLKSGLKWSNGAALTAADFVFALRRALDPATHSPDASLLYCVKNARGVNSGELDVTNLGVSAADDSTLVITLQEPDSDFIHTLTLPLCMPCNEEFFLAAKGRYGLTAETTLANGPFYVKKWEKGESMRISANEHYINAADTVAAGVQIYFDEIEDNAAALISADVDAAYIPRADVSRVGDAGMTCAGFSDKCYAVMFNTADSDFSSRTLRRIFAMGLDVQRAASATGLEPAQGLIPPSCTVGEINYRDTAGNVLIPADPSALDLLSSYISDNNDGERLPKIEIIYEESDSEAAALAKELSAVWQTGLNLFVNPTALSTSDFNGAVSGNDWQLAVTCISSDDNTPSNLLRQFSSDASHRSGYANADYDAQLGKIRAASADSVVEQCIAAENILIADAVVLPVAYSSSNYAFARGVSDIVVLPTGGHLYFAYARKTD